MHPLAVVVEVPGDGAVAVAREEFDGVGSWCAPGELAGKELLQEAA